MAFAVAYPYYLLRTGLGSRIRFDRARLMSLLGRGPARWGALSIVLYWLLFGLLAIQIATGVPLYLGYGGALVSTHLLVTWLLLAFVAAHLAVHSVFGGVNQLARVFRPVPNAIASAPFGAGPGRDGGGADGGPSRLLTARARLAIGTGVVALVAVVAFFLADRATTEVLPVARIPEGDAPRLTDGLSNAIWRDAKPLRIHTQQGANFNGTGETLVEVRALHDGTRAWFSFTWRDATLSLKSNPVIKTAVGWRVLRHESDLGDLGPAPSDRHRRPTPTDSRAFSEDKFSVMLSTSANGFGPGAFHAGARPLQDKPPSSSGNGLHYRTDGRSVEVWLWHAASLSTLRQCEHLTIGRPLDPSPAQILGRAPYKGGIRSDLATRPVIDNVQSLAVALNLSEGDPASGTKAIVPLRLPKSMAATEAAMGRVSLDADHGEPTGARWTMTQAESRPYSPVGDKVIPVGTIIPGTLATITDDPSAPDAGGALTCAARWEAGRWTLIVSRRLDDARTGDVRIGAGTFMWVAAFDHASARHTRHMRPIRLELK